MTVKATILGAGLACLAMSMGAVAQDAAAVPTPAAPQNVCQTDEHFKDFDFWLGTWRVTSRKTGRYQGTNTITKLPGDCMITEDWVNAVGGTGFSINYYNPMTKKWRQVWVSGPGIEIDYTGGLNEDGAMVLEGTIRMYSQNVTAPFRGTWTPNPDGTVRQFFEQYDPEKEVWNGWFDGVYTKVEEE